MFFCCNCCLRVTIIHSCWICLRKGCLFTTNFRHDNKRYIDDQWLLAWLVIAIINYFCFNVLMLKMRTCMLNLVQNIHGLQLNFLHTDPHTKVCNTKGAFGRNCKPKCYFFNSQFLIVNSVLLKCHNHILGCSVKTQYIANFSVLQFQACLSCVACCFAVMSNCISKLRSKLNLENAIFHPKIA